MIEHITPPSMDWIPGTGFDYFGEDDYNYGDLTTTVSLTPQVDLVGTPAAAPAGAIDLQGTGSLKRPNPPTDFRLAVESETPAVKIAMPPQLWWSWLPRMLMSKKRYLHQWEPLIADMLEEYYECLAEEGEWAARRTVLRHNCQAIPRWIKLLAWSLALKVMDWLKGG